jgi:glycosyltransferase involved in cell wall biosynthesis
MSDETIKIAVLLCSADISGGTYVIFEHASFLRSRGYLVYVVTEEEVADSAYSWHPAAAKLQWLTIDQAVSKNFDMVVATWWESPFLLYKLQATHYLYFVQSIESRFFKGGNSRKEDERNFSVWRQYCESTYSCNIPVITEASWIKEYLYRNYNSRVFLARNGIRKDMYTAEGASISPRLSSGLRVLVEGPVDVAYKNVPRSVELCRAAGVDEIWLLTSSDISQYQGVDRVFSRVDIKDTPAIYRSCDVLVKLSYIEGMFGPPLEMFHCGGTAIVYRVTGHDEYMVDGKNSYIVEKDDDQQVIAYLRQLSTNPKELARLKVGAAETAGKWIDWKSASTIFENALTEIRKMEATSREYLKSWASTMNSANLERLAHRELLYFQQREREGAESKNIDNFVQIYCWAEKDGLEKGSSTWLHYLSGQRVCLTVTLEVTGLPFWVRIDPSVRLGAVEIFAITVTNSESGKVVYRCDNAEKIAELFITGTLKRIDIPGKFLFLSYGDDPQVIIPAITGGKVGEILELGIEIKEMSMSELVEYVYSDTAVHRGSTVNRLWQKLLKR